MCETLVTAIRGSKMSLGFRSIPEYISGFILLVFAAALGAEQAPAGIAWDVHGSWLTDGAGTPIHTGDAIEPGSLLQPSGEAANHSITILLPDGQRILYECYLAEDCARSFRVPSLYLKPDRFAADLLARIHEVLARGSSDTTSRTFQQGRLPQDEALAVLGSGNQVSLGGLVASLPNGRYTYDLRPVESTALRRSRLILEKNAPSVSVAIPSPGLYDLRIADALNTPRIDLFVAVIRPALAASLLELFHHAKALLDDWNSDYQGWPVHDFQRAYLVSIGLNIKPPSLGRRSSAPEEVRRTGVTAEPAFAPRPGLFDGNTAVRLKCDTPGAIIHYTVDGSQPFKTSPVYGASIMVKGTALTIKAFATVPGKRDSAVVTGIFRIRE